MFVPIFFVFCLGLIVGSFLNVVIFRYGTGRGLGGRSGCMSCGKKLEWYELIPLFSFIVQKGMCRKCKSKLSWQYPVVELLTSLIFALLFIGFSYKTFTPPLILEAAIMAVAWCLLIVIAVYDLRHKIIPNSMVYTFAILGLIKVLIFTPAQPLFYFVVALLSGPILFIPFYLLWIVSNGRWIGLGDGKLALGIGWMLGLGYGVSAVFLAFWIGAIISVLILMFGKLKSKGLNLTMKSEIPFAPFLIIGFAIVYFFAVDVAHLHSVFGI